MREWFEALPTMRARAAAFDTRVNLAAALTGRASRGIGRRLRRHGLDLVAEKSFLVTTRNRLVPGETTRARQWGERLAGQAPAST